MLTYTIVQINGHQYVQHVEGGRVPATDAEREFWERLQSETRQKTALVAECECLRMQLECLEYNFLCLAETLADRMITDLDNGYEA